VNEIWGKTEAAREYLPPALGHSGTPTAIKKEGAGVNLRLPLKKTGLVSQGVTEKPGEFSN